MDYIGKKKFKKIRSIYHLNLQMSHADYQAKLAEKNPNVEVLEPYRNAKTPILHRCKLCGREYKSAPDNILHNINGCPQCGYKQTGARRRKTNEQFLEELKGRPDLISLESYAGARTKIKFQCTICGRIWTASPTNILRGHGCPSCGFVKTGDIHRITQEDFLERLHQIHGDTIIALEPYQNINIPIKFKCNKCDKEWYADPAHILRGHGCWECNSSQGEHKVAIYLSSHHIAYESQKTFDDLKGIGGKKIRYDFYLPEYHLLIEYDGIQHFEPVEYFGGQEKFELQKEHDRRKEEYATQHGINLLHIKYTEDVNTTLDNYLANLKLESRETVMVI